MKHTIDISEIGDITKTIDLAGHFGHSVDKELYLEVHIRPNGKVLTTYQVKTNKQVVLSTEDIFAAVEKYNSIG